MDFDGSNDRAQTSAALTGASGTQTIELWLRPDVTNQNGIIIAHASVSAGWSLEVDNGQPIFYTDGGGWSSIQAQQQLLAGTWYHLTVTYQSGTAVMYLNGVQVAQGNVGSIGSAPRLTIGGLAGFPFFNGQIDEIRISNTVRYTSNFSFPTTAFSTDENTTALYHLDEGTGQTALDSSGNGFDLIRGTSTATQNTDPAWILSTAPIDNVPVAQVDDTSDGTFEIIQLRIYLPIVFK